MIAAVAVCLAADSSLWREPAPARSESSSTTRMIALRSASVSVLSTVRSYLLSARALRKSALPFLPPPPPPPPPGDAAAVPRCGGALCSKLSTARLCCLLGAGLLRFLLVCPVSLFRRFLLVDPRSRPSLASARCTRPLSPSLSVAAPHLKLRQFCRVPYPRWLVANGPGPRAKAARASLGPATLPRPAAAPKAAGDLGSVGYLAPNPRRAAGH